MTHVLETDLCIIGAGAAGLSVAAAAARLGRPVVLIEKGKMGGDCLNYGCVPSKSLLAAAKRAHQAGVHLGVTLTAAVDFPAVQAHVHNVIAAIAPHDSQERFESLGCTVLRAPARFTGPRQVTAGDQVIAARRFVIATGSRPRLPDIPGLAAIPYLTNETIFDLTALPPHLLILGGGPVGCELAQAFRRLGSKVTLVSRRLLAKDDPDLVAVVRRALLADGVRIVDGADVTAAALAADGVALTLSRAGQTETITGSHVLVAAGRTPAIDGLGLDAAGVRYTDKGIMVDRRLRTTNRRIFAVGDVTGRTPFTHMAGYDAGIVVRNALFRLPAKVRLPLTPWCTYTDPELAQAGLTEAAARAAGHKDIRVVTWPFADNDRARTEGGRDGLVKVVATRRGRILGAGIAGPQAGELIQPWCLALAQGLKMAAMAGYIAPYPTLGEINKRAAGLYFEPTVFSAGMKRLVSFLARLG